MAVEPGWEAFSARVMAAVDFEAAAAALVAGVLPCSSGERRVLRLAASIGAGVPVDLREALTGLDEANSGLVAAAVLHAAGRRDLLAAAGRPVSRPAAVTVTRHRDALEGQALRVLGRLRRHGGSGTAGGAARWQQADDPGGVDRRRPASGEDGCGPAATLGAVSDLLAACVLVSGLSARRASQQEQAARQSPCKEDDRAACPAQSAAGGGSGATLDDVSPSSASRT